MSNLTQKLASLGNHGKHKQNIERDLFRVLNLPVSPYYVELPLRSQLNRAEVVLERVPMLLPHELYHYMFEPRHVEQLFFIFVFSTQMLSNSNIQFCLFLKSAK